MAEEITHHITVRLARDYEFVAEFNDVPAASPVLFDEPAPLGGGRGPNAAAMLGAAVGNCLAASLAFCLRKARVELLDVSAQVTTHVGRNERGRHRITGIEVALTPSIGRTGAPVDRCGDLFEDFCTVTASIRHGIPVTVTLAPTAASIES